MTDDENILKNTEFEYESEITNPLPLPELSDDYEPQTPEERELFSKYQHDQGQVKLDQQTRDFHKDSARRRKSQAQYRKDIEKVTRNLEKIMKDTPYKNLD